MQKLFLFLIIFFLAGASIASEFELDEAQKKKREQDKIERALENLSGDNYKSFENSIFKFEQMGEEAVPILVAHLKNNKEDQKIRVNTIYTIGRLGAEAKGATPIITPFLMDEDADTRAIAAIALGKIGPGAEDSVRILVNLLNDENEWVRKSVHDALRKIGTKEAKEAVRQYNQKKRNNTMH